MINKPLFALLICLSLLWFTGMTDAGAEPANAPEPELVGEAALLIDAANGQVLLEKKPDRQMYPASTTKILTALVALEKSSLKDDVLVSRRAAEIGGSRIGLQPGEKVKMEHLLYILMLSSANDAAVAIAEHVGGSVEQFAVLMNARARDAGARNSNFVNPHGMPDKNHYSTARDMAIIGREAMENSMFRKISGTVSYKVDRKSNMTPELLEQIAALERIYGPVQEDFYNHNKILSSTYYGVKGATGIKTGYTVDAGQCIVASAERGGRELIAVVLRSQGANLWTDASKLLDYGFSNFERVRLVKPGEIISDAAVRHGSARAVLETTESFYYNFPVGEAPEVQRKVELMKSIVAPLPEGEQIGDLILELDEQELGRVQLANIHPVSRKFTSHWWFWAAVVGIVSGLLWILTQRRPKRRVRDNLIHMRKRDRW